MGVMHALPRGPLTQQDLQAMPDDGHRYELVDGVLIVTPAPKILHQRVLMRLAMLLQQAAPAGVEVLPAPTDYVVSAVTVLQPDLLVARSADLGEANLQRTPLLVVEVGSPSTIRIDRGTKRLAFEAAGVPSYWLVDPDEPSLTTLELVDGVYVEAAQVAGNEAFTATSPFPLQVVPVDLVR